MIKVLSIFGTRPEAIKFASVIKNLEDRPTLFESRICITGQHREMLNQVLDVFSIKPDYDLKIMKPNQDLFDITSHVLLGLKEILLCERPDWILVHGDTTTTISASLAAYYCQIKIGHIEAGLRTNDKYSPFPEEINRRATDLLSDSFFTSTETAKANLLNEGVPDEKIIVTGSTVVDALLQVLSKVRNRPSPIDELSNIDWSKRIILVTGHRRESFGKDFNAIHNALLQVAEFYPDINIILPIHLNPNVQRSVVQMLRNSPNIYLIPPQNYENFVWLMTKAYFILTDSGGIQEEAPSLNKPVLVMRRTTERPEGIEAGAAKLIGTEKDSIVENVKLLLEDNSLYSKMAQAINPYGDGLAGVRVVEALQQIGGYHDLE